jgi:hypothetical protein
MRQLTIRCSALIALILFFVSTPSESLARSWQVQLSHSGTDPLGKKIAYEVRGIIQMSSSLELYNELVPIWVKIVLVTMYIDDKKNNLISCYSVAVVLCSHDKRDNSTSEQYVSSWVGICGGNRVHETAESIIDGVSKHLSALSQVQPAKEPLK